MKNLILTRPLCIIDIETTGLETSTARIVEISVMKLHPTESPSVKTRRLNPGVPIPAEVTAVHGIDDDMVHTAPSFASIAKILHESLEDCDLAGYNLKRFDLPVLCHEFERCGIEFDPTNRAHGPCCIIDVQEIFFKREPRDLAGAVKFYTLDEHKGHSAEGDVLATAKVLDRMLDFYPDLPRGSADIAAALTGDNVDIAGKFCRRPDGVIVFGFGKYKDKPITEERGYLSWMLLQDFLPDVRQICRQILNPS